MRRITPTVVCLWVILALLTFGKFDLPAIPWLPLPVITDTSPIPDLGLRVLVTYDETNRGNLPTGQKRIIDSTELRAWLDANCVKDAKGVPGWRIWPDDRDTTDDPIIGKLLAIAKGKNEWLVVADGKRGTSEALPADLDKLNAILLPYGGGK